MTVVGGAVTVTGGSLTMVGVEVRVTATGAADVCDGCVMTAAAITDPSATVAAANTANGQ